jgi:transcriptional regulator with XRE-family HTH domain
MDTSKVLSKNIHRLRSSRGWSMVKLADFSGVSYQTVFRAESKGIMPRGDSLAKIAKALNTTIAGLYEDPKSSVVDNQAAAPKVDVFDRAKIIGDIVLLASTMNQEQLTIFASFQERLIRRWDDDAVLEKDKSKKTG